MRKLLLAAIAALLAAGSAGAIINGEPDGTRHPYVVAIGFIDAATNRPGAFCTGTLVSPTVVVTAGHCTFGSARAFVWNDPVWSSRSRPASFGLPVTHPDFNPELSTPNTGDLGVVRLAIPIQLATYGALPPAGYLDDLGRRRGLEFGVTIVGYGVQSLDPLIHTGERMLGRARIQNLNSSTVRDYGLKTSGVNGGGRSGTCLGDSGGPILHGDSNLVVGVNSFGKNESCTIGDYSYRTDTAASRAFLGQFVPLP